jgi:hypothetical protein
MLDLLLVATMLLVCGGIGLPLAQLLPDRFAWRLLLAPTLGTCVLAVAVPIAYRAGITIVQLFWISLALAIVVLALRARATLRMVRALSTGERRFVAIITGVCAVATLILLAPRWAGGDQFSVFQGNQWDTFGYLESAMVYAREPHSAIQGITDLQAMHNPMLTLATSQLHLRPSVHELYAVFSRVAPGQAYRLYYPFLVFPFVQLIGVIMFVLRNAFPAMTRASWLAIALVFPLGFWGQYVFDINAWSQIAAQPVLVLMFGITIHSLARPEHDSRAAVRIGAVLAIAVAGAIYLYPEGLLVYAVALGPLAIVVLVVRAIAARRLALVPVIPLLGFAGAAAVVLYPPQLAFLIAQIRFTSGTKVSWWEFFQTFFYGRDGVVSHGFPRVADFTAGLFGLYFATPAKGAVAIVALLRRVAIITTVVGLLAGVGALLAGKSENADREARLHAALWAIAAVVMLLPALRLALDENYWPAGKIVAFAAPVFTTLLCIPVGFAFVARPLRIVRAIMIVFIAFALVTGVTRIAAARRAHGIHYAPPYPSVQAVELKRDLRWDLTALEALTADTKVLMKPMDLWAQSYLTMFLYSRGIPFAIDGKINTYFGSGTDLPGRPPPWTPDAEITVAGREIVVTFRDGRAPLRVVSDEDLR